MDRKAGMIKHRGQQQVAEEVRRAGDRLAAGSEGCHTLPAEVSLERQQRGPASCWLPLTLSSTATAGDLQSTKIPATV